MEKFQPTDRATQTVPMSKPSRRAPRKAAWHRPTVTFVSLGQTAFTIGSPIDGSTSGSTTPPP